MMHPKRGSHGFTVLELVVALAVAIVLIVTVSSVTHALTDTARRQRALSEQALRHEKFAELLRRDLRGWLACDGIAVSAPASKAGELTVLQFCTLADGLSPNYSSGGNGSRAISTVQYLVRKALEGYDVVRVETGADGGTFELQVLQCAEEPHFEFWTEKGWIEKWDFSKRPFGVRVATGINFLEVFLT